MNEFASTDIHLPEQYREHFHAYCLTRTDGSGNNPVSSPFPRMVDMWFMALCIAAREGLKPVASTPAKTYKAIEGVVFGGNDTWRSNAMMLLAISHTEDVEVMNRPHDMMRIANSYALAGLPRLLGILQDKGDDAIDHLSEVVEELLQK